MTDLPRPARLPLLSGDRRVGYWYLRAVEGQFRLSRQKAGDADKEFDCLDFDTAEACVDALVKGLNEHLASLYEKFLAVKKLILEGRLPERQMGFRPGYAKKRANQDLRNLGKIMEGTDGKLVEISTTLQQLGWPPLTGLAKPWA